MTNSTASTSSSTETSTAAAKREEKRLEERRRRPEEGFWQWQRRLARRIASGADPSDSFVAPHLRLKINRYKAEVAILKVDKATLLKLCLYLEPLRTHFRIFAVSEFSLENLDSFHALTQVIACLRSSWAQVRERGRTLAEQVHDEFIHESATRYVNLGAPVISEYKSAVAKVRAARQPAGSSTSDPGAHDAELLAIADKTCLEIKANIIDTLARFTEEYWWCRKLNGRYVSQDSLDKFRRAEASLQQATTGGGGGGRGGGTYGWS